MGNSGNGLRIRLRRFVDEHPHGWRHQEWLELLAELTDEGVDTSDPDRIGSVLERERVAAVLEEMPVRGLGPKRRQALIDRFGSVWDLSHASADEIAALPSFHRKLAEALVGALR
ncbi:MAG: helix-hairpin-helix domain-containing protein [Gemmatimonadota bacterium]|jgi:excinuclease ABC subunit C